MTTKTRTRRSTKPRRDIAQEVTDKVMASLRDGVIPWRKPWTAANGMVPTSVSTGRPYRGINTLLLWLESSVNDYSSPYWLTFKQAQERGGSVRKGERGTLVVFWKKLEVKDTDAVEDDATKTVLMMRHYTVFNLDQCDDVTLPPRFNIERPEPRPVPEVVGEVLSGYVNGPTVKFQLGDSAHYTPSTDVVVIPEVGQFADDDGLISTTFHELVHSTGHATRLNRFERNGEPQHFGTERYAREELVAETGNAMLRALVGLEMPEQDTMTAAYVANWLKALDEDKTLVVKAAQQAQKAVDRILGDTDEEETR